MKANSDLYHLVHSLSKERKTRFRKSAQKTQHRGPSLYLRLFDVLDKQSSFDDEMTKSHFKGEPCLKQFTRIKHYLYEQLLVCLVSESRGNSASEQARIYLQETHFLQDQGLYSQAFKRLNRAKSLIEKYEFTIQRIDLLAQERELLRKLPGKSVAPKLKRLRLEEEQALSQLLFEIQAKQIYDQELFLAKQSPGENEKDLFEALQLPEPGMPFNAQLALHLANALRFRRQQMRQKAHHHYHAAFQIWQANPHQVQEYPERFYRLTSAYLSSGHAVGDYAGFIPWLEKLQKDSALPKPMRNNLLCMSYNLQLLFHLNQQQLTEAHKLASGLSQTLKYTSSRLSSWMPAATNLSVLYFISGQYAAAKHWIDQILDLPRGPERRDLRGLARVLHLLVLYETNNRDLIHYAWRSTERFIRKKRSLNQLEMALGVFFRKIDQAATIKDERKAQQVLRNKIYEIGDNKALVGLEEVRLWINQKVNPKNIE